MISPLLSRCEIASPHMFFNPDAFIQRVIEVIQKQDTFPPVAFRSM